MTDQPNTEAPQADPAPEASESPTEAPKPDEAALGDPGKAALAAERKRANEAEKALRAAQERVKQFEDATKSETEKAAERLTAAEKAAAQAASQLARYEVAFEKSVPGHLLEFVTGSTREEVEASVEKVLAAFGATGGAKPTPKADPSQGVQGAPTSLDQQIADAEKAGDIKRAIYLKSRKGLASN